MTVEYIQVNSDKPTTSNQRNKILEYSNRNNLQVDEFIEVEMSSRKFIEDRKIDLLQRLK